MCLSSGQFYPCPGTSASEATDTPNHSDRCSRDSHCKKFKGPMVVTQVTLALLAFTVPEEDKT